MKKKIIAFIFVILYLSINYTVYNTIENNKRDRIKVELDRKLDNLETHYKVIMYNQKLSADTVYRSTVSMKKVINILSLANTEKDIKKLSKLRAQLQTILQRKYDIMKQKGVLQYHFVFPNNISFLRMHKPSKYGDDLSDIREDIKYVNIYQKSVSGFTQGRTAHGFRNTYPIFDKNNNYLAAMEVSYSSEFLQEQLTTVSKIHTHFLIKKNIFDSNAWSRDDLVLKYLPSAENDDYMITMTNQHSIKKCIIQNSQNIKNIKEQIKEEMNKDKKFSKYTYQNDFHVPYKHIDTFSFYPIENVISKEIVAWLVAYGENNKLIKSTTNNSQTMFILFSIVLFLLLFFIYIIINQKDILNKKVNEKTKELHTLNDKLEERIVEEVKKNQDIQKKLFQSEKLSSMGEMIGNIAHQWRQPLSVISTGVTGMQVQKECGLLSDERFNSTCTSINDNAQYLSKTIEDFKNFIKGDSQKKEFKIKNTISSFIHLVDGVIKDNSINIILDLDENISINGYENELNQCLINLFNNAKDALYKNSEDNRLIFITIFQQNQQVIIKFKDNGSGINEEIINKIFEPYFTTKHQSIGTGLGLNMTYELIVECMHGEIEVENVSYTYENSEHKGTEFTITLPLA